MIYAFAGGRDYQDRAMVNLICDMLMADDSNEFSVGDCPTGADLFVRERIPSTRIDVHRAEWTLYGKLAGPRRNAAMLEDTDVLIAFPGNNGTKDCVAKARRARIPVIEVGAFGNGHDKLMEELDELKAAAGDILISFNSEKECRIPHHQVERLFRAVYGKDAKTPWEEP